MTTDTASSDSSATSPFTAFDQVHVDAHTRGKQCDELRGFKRKDPETSDLQNAMPHAASPSTRKQFSQEPHGGSYANKRRPLSVKEAESSIIRAIKELAYNNHGIIELFPPGDSSSLAFEVRGVCTMQRLVINEMEEKYYNGEGMDIYCIMGHCQTMHENMPKLIPLVRKLPPVFCSRAMELVRSIFKLQLCCFDMACIPRPGTATLASNFENSSSSEGVGSSPDL